MVGAMVKGLKYAKYHIDNERDGKIIRIDEGFTETTGYTWEEACNGKMTIFDLVPEYEADEYRQAVYAAQQKEDSYLAHDIRCKDGSIITVHCFGEIYFNESIGHVCSKILITDITEQAKAVDELGAKEEQLALQIEKIKFLSEDAREIFMDYDIQRDYFEISTFVEGEYKIFYTKENYFNSDIRTIHEDDFDAMCQALLVNESDNAKRSIDFRSRLFLDTYNWYRMVYTTYINPKTGKSHIIGRITDINDEKLASLKLEKGAETDKLTGVYNRITTENKINEILDNSGENASHAMVLIDIDHLKDINVSLGYNSGDKVLENTGRLLTTMFRQNFDIIGRVDGDVFVVFIRNALDVFYVESRCRELCMRIRQECTPLYSKQVVTASLGIALSDSKHKTFKKMYKKAEKALQRQVEKGQDGYSF